jgi:hypothetical protein
LYLIESPQPVGPAGIPVERGAAQREVRIGRGIVDRQREVGDVQLAGAVDEIVKPARDLSAQPPVEAMPPQFRPFG